MKYEDLIRRLLQATLERVPEKTILLAVLKAASARCKRTSPRLACRPNRSYTPYLEALESTSRQEALVAIDSACAEVADDLVALLRVGGNSSAIVTQFLRMRDEADERSCDTRLRRERVSSKVWTQL